MNTFVTKLAVLLIVIVAFVDGILVAKHFAEEGEEAVAIEAPIIEDVFTGTKTAENTDLLTHDVPFTTQAILGWGSPWDRYAEETCVYMAMKWVQGQTIDSANQTATDLLAIGTWENQNFGQSGDTTATETLQIITSYYSHLNAYLLSQATTDEIKNLIHSGHLILLTINGQALESPYYGNPAPSHHAILLTGYDETQNSFIANDPGTSHGEQIYCSYEKILASIQDSLIVIKP